MKPLIDYPAWDRLRRGSWSKPQNVPLRLFTAEGLSLYRDAKAFVGRYPNYKGGSKKGIYFKWKVLPTDDMGQFMAFADWIRDRDYEVTVGYKTGVNFKDRDNPHRYVVLSISCPFKDTRVNVYTVVAGRSRFVAGVNEGMLVTTRRVDGYNAPHGHVVSSALKFSSREAAEAYIDEYYAHCEALRISSVSRPKLKVAVVKSYHNFNCNRSES